MELKFLWVKSTSFSLGIGTIPKVMLFVIYSDEELRVRKALAASGGKYRIVLDGSMAAIEGAAESTDLRQIKRLIGKSESLVLSSRGLSSPELAGLVCQAYVSCTRVMDLEAVLLQIDPSVPASSEMIVRMLAQHSAYQGIQLRTYAAIKYAAEPVLAAILLVLLLPVLIAVAIAIRLTSAGPVIYRQERLGLGGRPFDLLKFRSMRIDAEKNGPVWASAAKADDRVTTVGRILRATHLDELPQLWNVVRGELSFIGPRPERSIFVEQLSQDFPLFRLRTLMKPGITGWAQVNQGYANSVEDSRRKLEFDFFYLLKHSAWLDTQIVIKTVLLLVSGGTEGKKRERAALAGPAVGPVSRKKGLSLRFRSRSARGLPSELSA